MFFIYCCAFVFSGGRHKLKYNEETIYRTRRRDNELACTST